ncbi:MAG TPA: DegT/DnrJ/EryC1/StrS family aminotransferase [Candidatus Eisenbacteria bacterium]|nr:DegT/DnrJ/EryC1/StrS family aminotransferase [Candidatus Eisenbacteria bacterium]
MRIPLSAPDVLEEEIQAVAEVLRTPHLSLGPKLAEFEGCLASYLGARNTIAVSSGTAGLHLCFRALGIGEGDEVIVPSFAFIAVANVLRYERASPIFVDIEPQTLNLDPSRIEAAITPRTKAILVVHTFGCPAELGQIMSIAWRHNLYVIEDACEAIGAEYEGKKVGTLGHAGVFAFYPNKQITTGEGGAVATADSALASKMRALRNQGRMNSDGWFQHSEVGYNYRLSEMNCALGITQLKRIEAILARRADLAGMYNQKLTGLQDLRLPVPDLAGCKLSWFVYVLRLAEHFSESQRDWIVQEMNRRGIGCGRYFAPIHRQPAYSKATARPGQLPVTERESVRCLALPFFNRLRDSEISEVCETLSGLVGDIKKKAPTDKAAAGGS